MMIRLEDFIGRQSEEDSVVYVPTYSIHARLAKRYVNEIIDDHPEYARLIKAIVSFPLQKWAALSRSKAGIDLESITQLIETGEAGFFGIKEKDFLCNQKNRLILSEKIIDYLENVVLTPDQDVLLAIHGYKKNDVSKFIMTSHYKNLLLDVCRKHCKEFSLFSNQINSEYVALDDDIQFVYHKTNILLRLHSAIKDLNYDENSNIGIDYKRAADCIDACIACLDSYYLQDPKLRKVAHYYSRGHKETEICNLVGRSRSYVRRTIKESSKAISYIVWGYFNI